MKDAQLWTRSPRWLAGFSLLTALVLALTLALALPLSSAQAAEETYTVHNGDNLTGIAARFGLSVDALAKSNGVANVNNIYPGQVLKLPRANAPAASKPAAQATDLQAYIVQQGDTLSGLAQRFGVSQVELASVNGLSVMSYLYVGQTLRIPGAAAPANKPINKVVVDPPTPQSSVTTAPASSSSAMVSNYTVQPGDTLTAVARRYGTTVDAILQLNNLANPNILFVGQKLLIPGAGAVVVATTAAATPKPATPTPAKAAQTTVAQAAPSQSRTGKWIDVNLSQQRLTAYEGNTSVFTSLVSTGVSAHPTVVGTFNIYVKYGSQAMSGPGYYLPGVPYVMYFYEAYAIHGTYWHNNFGHPMSHGCVNLPTPAAQFMYSWAPIGTPVVIHY